MSSQIWACRFIVTLLEASLLTTQERFGGCWEYIAMLPTFLLTLKCLPLEVFFNFAISIYALNFLPSVFSFLIPYALTSYGGPLNTSMCCCSIEEQKQATGRSTISAHW